MGAVDLVVQVESPPSVASGLQRVGRAGHQVGAVSRGVIFPKYRGDLRRVRRRGRADARRARSSRCATRATRSTCSPSRSSRWSRWTLVTVDEVEALVRRAAPFAGLPAVGARGDARHARRPLPVRRVRRAASAPGLGPRHRRADRPARRAAARGHQRRHDPRPRPVRRLPRRRRGPGPAGRRARRGDGLRVARRRRVPARLVLVADRGHHARPGAGHARARPGRPDAVLEGRLARPPGRARPRARRVPARAGARVARRRRARAAAAAGLDEWGADNLLAYLAEQREATGTLPDDRTSWSSGSATSSATGGWSCTRRSARR